MSHRGLHSDPLRRSTPPARPVASVVATLRPARSTVTMVAVASVAPNPTNPPGRSEANLDELISSIRQVGVLQAVTVVPAAQYLAVHPEQVEQIGDADFVTLGGHRRRAAAVLAGIHEMPAVIRTDLGPRLDEVAAHENLHRRAFNPIEEALTFRLNLEVQGLSQRQLATALCLSQAHISKRLALLRLPAAVQDAIAANELSVADGLRLAREDHPGVLERVVEGLTERQVSMEERIAAAAVEVARDRDRERAAAVAAAQGLALMTDPAGAFGTSWQRHRLHDAEQIDRARERGDLAVGIPDGKEPVPYYRLSAPRDLDGPSTPTPTRGEARERSAAARARTAHLITLAPSKPSSAQWSRLLAEVTIGGWTVASPTGTALVRRLARQAGVGPGGADHGVDGIDDAAWRAAILGTSARTRWQLAWLYALVACEEHAAAPRRVWGEAERVYLATLHEFGYVPTRWEAEQLGAIESAAQAPRPVAGARARVRS